MKVLYTSGEIHLYLRQRETLEEDLGRLPKSKDGRKTINKINL
jgi:hypothetical protein